MYRPGEGPCIRKPKAEWQRPEGQFGFGAYKEEPWSLQAIEKRVYAVRDTYTFFLKGTSFDNPGHHDRINEVLSMLRLIVGYKAKHVPKALDKEKLAALLGAADVSNPAVLSVAAFIAKNVVQGNRARIPSARPLANNWPLGSMWVASAHTNGADEPAGGSSCHQAHQVSCPC